MTSQRVFFGLAIMVCTAAYAETPLKLERKVPIPGVEGRMDHLTLDASGKRLWLAALGNDSIEVVDLESGVRIKSIEGIRAPTGVALWPEMNRVIVAGGGDGTLRAFDASYDEVASVERLDDADNVRFDPVENRVYVAFGHGAIAVVDVRSFEKRGEISLDGHPESFQLEPDGRRIFVNVPSARHIAVIDRAKAKVVATWPLSGAQANYPMALDARNRRLFVVCRHPARLLALDLDSGKQVAAIDCCGDADDVFYDAADKRIYVSGGEGCVSVVAQESADEYRESARIPTAKGASTSLLVPETKTLYVAVPHRGDQRAAIWSFKAGR